MTTEAQFVPTSLDRLLERAQDFKSKGWRFVQCCATRTGDSLFELLYTFTDDSTQEIASLRVSSVGPADEVPSVGGLFPCAFMFENEMHDLFGINIVGITLDYRGGFYHLHIPAPMALAPEGPAKRPAPKPARQEA